MAGQTTNQRAYSPSQGTVGLAPSPIVSPRAPTTTDRAPIGTNWCDTTDQAAYILVAIVDNESIWTTAPASGATVVTSLLVTPGDLTVDTGNVDITFGDLSVGGDTTLTGDLTVDGTATFSGTLDFTSAGEIIIESTANSAPSILLHANGGAAEQILLHSDQGTAADSVLLLSDVGGIKVHASGDTGADSVRLTSDAGGIEIDAALKVLVASSDNAAQSIFLNANGGATETVEIRSTQGTGATSVLLNSVAGGVTVSGAKAAADAVNITATDAVGGITATSGSGSINLNASHNAPTNINTGTSTGAVSIGNNAAGTVAVISNTASAVAISLTAHNAAGGVSLVSGSAGVNLNASVNQPTHINSGTSSGAVVIGNNNAGDITLDSFGIISLDSAAASNFTVTGAAADLTLTSVGGSVNIGATEAIADAVVIAATDVAGGIELSTGGGAIALSSAGAVSMVPATGSVGSPTASQTINSRVVVATFTGFTTAAAATQVFTLVSSAHGAGSGVIISAANKGTNDAQMSIQRVNTQTAGTIAVTLKNNGAAALNGDVVLTFWIIS